MLVCWNTVSKCIPHRLPISLTFTDFPHFSPNSVAANLFRRTHAWFTMYILVCANELVCKVPLWCRLLSSLHSMQFILVSHSSAVQKCLSSLWFFQLCISLKLLLFAGYISRQTITLYPKNLVSLCFLKKKKKIQARTLRASSFLCWSNIPSLSRANTGIYIWSCCVWLKYILVI